MDEIARLRQIRESCEKHIADEEERELNTTGYIFEEYVFKISDGKKLPSHVVRELYLYHKLKKNVRKVYNDITNGQITKIDEDPSS